MRWELKLNTDATTEPVTTAEAKTHLRITHTDEDAYIATLIKAARMEIENRIRRTLITQTWELHLTDWPWQTYIRLPKGTLRSVTSLIYTDDDGNNDTVSTDVYGVDANSTPGRIYLKPDQTWPSESLYEGTPIKITYVVGYGDASTDVPQALIHAVKLLVGDLYENRETIVVGQTINTSRAIESLVAPYKVRSVYP